MILLTEGQTMSRLFDLDWQLVADSCLTIIAVFVLFLCMSYFLFNPARKMLNSRKDKIRDRARTEAALEKQKVSDEVKQEIISVASVMAGKMVAASIDTTVQNQLIDETLKEIGDKTWLN